MTSIFFVTAVFGQIDSLTAVLYVKKMSDELPLKSMEGLLF